ncbi:hypothetical protein PMIN06_004022 [Paraphaeosphaeria minitans]|uniref:Fungal specific transcription factor domain-containing protein n=1 Tax=Paraphaeosphaeria minitans TaxID=565426 RepID=A0A9P6GBX2_9PLEO|nr:fungal specific transcription factor domain-containing protein [Paraphaeosphaeria minitans]
MSESALVPGLKRRHQTQQSRQLLSCTKCRERKVKCDRTKPCSACCARGAPKECHFVADGGDYAPIQQSYEIRKLRAENLRLKERLRASKIPLEEHESDHEGSPDSQFGERLTGLSQRRRAAKQKRFQGSEWSDSIYFGSPGLANVVTDFASIHLAPGSSQSLAHLMPRGTDIYTSKSPPPYPFPTLFKPTPEEGIPELLSCLPTTEELLEYLNFFEKRVHLCAFPHIPMEITRDEVERFLSDPRKNAQMCPDMLALLFAALALGSQYSTWDRSGGQWKADTMKAELQRGNVYIAAAMQALRMTSFMHKPSLLGIQALIMIGPFLTNSGRFLDAWTLFGTTIRLAHAIGLHRHPRYLDPAPPTQRECSIRQTIWWWMLHMDQEYSMTLGRPLGISGIGDCPPPHELTTNPQMLRFGEFANHFTLLARQILSSDRLNNSKIDEFTDQLRNLLDTMPEMLQFDETWLDKNKEVPEWPLGTMAAGVSCHNLVSQHSNQLLTHVVFYCKTHTYLILLNRQRIEKQSAQFFNAQNASTARATSASFQPVNAYSFAPGSPKASRRGRALVLSSSQDLLTAFLFFHFRVPAAQITWTMGQQAFNSCMILLLDAMETGELSRISKVEKAYVVFQQLEKNGVHELASMAVERVSWGLAELGRMNRAPDIHVRLHPPISSRGGVSSRDVEMQDGNGSEARQGSGGVHDTVMGNTGMFLLEDPGLQSFVPEAFAPLTWSVSRGFPEGGASLALRLKEEAGQKQTEEVEDAEPRLYKETRDARSSERRPDAPGTPGSAPDRFATLSTEPPQSFQPQGLTAPTSPPTSATILQEQHDHQHSIRDPQMDHHEHPPPHWRHHSYPSLHQGSPPSSTSEPRATDPRRVSQDVTAARSGRRFHSQMAKADGNWSEEVDAGKMHRTVSHFASLRPSLQALPEYATTLASTQFIAFNNPNVHPSWAARPAAPSSSASEPTLAFSQMVNRGQVIPAYTQEGAPMTTWQHTFPLHMSSTSSDAVPAPTGTQAEHFVSMDGWT